MTNGEPKNERAGAMRVLTAGIRAGSWWPHAVLLPFVLLLVRIAESEGVRWANLMREDGWAEWATFLAFFTAGVLALQHAWRSRPRGTPEFALVGLAVFCFFVAGEEISWAQRLLGYRPPDLFLEKNFQQEANLHNLLKNIFDTRWMVFWFSIVYGVVLPIAAEVVRAFRAFAPSIQFLPWFGLVAWFEYEYPYHLTGEFAELTLGLIVIADVVERRARGQAATGGWVTAAVLGAVLAGAVLVAPVTDAVFYRHAGGRLPAARDELAELQRVLSSEGVLRERLFKKRRVHKRMFTTVQSRYLDIPVESFFLDPWNQAYWFTYERTGEGEGRVLLYSFGPNRRRDSDTKRLGDPSVPYDEMLAGDDVGVGFSVRQEDGRPSS